MTKRYAVLGNPIAHSLSPAIHRQFAQINQRAVQYDKLLVELDEFETRVTQCARDGYTGLNITVPFKRHAWDFADTLSPQAQQCRLVNTLIRREQSWHGETTDGKGLLADLHHLIGDELSDLRIVILGAGGSVHGVLPNLLNDEPASIHIANRTAKRAQQLAQRQSDPRVTWSGLDDCNLTECDLLINATAAGLHGEVAAVPGLRNVSVCAYDLMYAAEETPFIRWAKRQLGTPACGFHDGLGMLVRQAALSAALWGEPTLSEKDQLAVITAMRESISSRS